mmetsp:Transcript_6003/g.18078  ORF Transcript_6003/g.18078 Transcript_6003/m.18078 type:complete len:121 (+) Transcript_6003:91-453(+)
MSKFIWGDSFFRLNGELLDAYAECSTSTEVVEVQRQFLSESAASRKERDGGASDEDDLLRRNPNHDYSSSEELEEDSEGGEGESSSENELEDVGSAALNESGASDGGKGDVSDLAKDLHV